EGYSLALVTFSLALAIPQIIQYFDGWTGGSKGIVLDAAGMLGGDEDYRARLLYYVSLVALIGAFWLTHNMIRSRSGRAIRAIKDRPLGAFSVGINIPLYKALTFAISALLTGVAGALSAVLIGHVSPSTYSFILSISFVIGVTVGGIGALMGAL